MQTNRTTNPNAADTIFFLLCPCRKRRQPRIFCRRRRNILPRTCCIEQLQQQLQLIPELIDDVDDAAAAAFVNNAVCLSVCLQPKPSREFYSLLLLVKTKTKGRQQRQQLRLDICVRFGGLQDNCLRPTTKPEKGKKKREKFKEKNEKSVSKVAERVHIENIIRFCLLSGSQSRFAVLLLCCQRLFAFATV